MSASAPRVSILIPNYNNGRDSSTDGRHDLIARLLESLRRTLDDDPTPLEIIAYDDGSTDDSRQTLRDWSQKTWRSGQRFLKLIEAPHCGVLSVTANKLVHASVGDILVRLDGDVECLTDRWAASLCELFDQGPPRLGVIGPKQLGSDGRIHAFGDFVLHPKGYHHLAQGFDRYAVRHAIEVDHVMGCFYCCRRAVYDEVGGFDERILRGQTVDFGLAARFKGWSAIAVPHIEFAHHHGVRSERATRADSESGVDHTLAYFREKWGFCRIAPDLDVVRERYRGTPLLWNAAVFGMPREAQAAPVVRPTQIDQTAWGAYASDESYRRQINLRLGAVVEVLKQVKDEPRVAVLEAGVGLVPHLLATRGLTVAGVESNPHEAALAQSIMAQHDYPGPRPTITHQAEPRHVPLDDGSAEVVLLCDVVQRHRNPARLLAEARRVLADEGRLVVTTRQHPRSLPTALDSEHPYQVPELVGQIRRAAGCTVINDPTPRAPDHPLIAVGKPVAAAAAVSTDITAAAA
jgi:glycosyltransferase involved in cell wall biosynthesis/SAM-dependent methyltransferase